MASTWKKWACFLLTALVLGTACHLLAWRWLVSTETFWPIMTMRMASRGTPGDRPSPWYEQIVELPLEISYAPWPLWPLAPSAKARALDLDHPQTQDAETIMGLGLLGPVPAAYAEDRSDDPNQRYERWARKSLSWFAQRAEQALALADDPGIRRQLERLVLYAQNAALRREGELIWPWADPPALRTAPSSRPSSAPSRRDLRRYVRQRARQIDPTNAVYYYDQALEEIQGIVERLEPSTAPWPALPSDSLACGYRLADPQRLVPVAESVDALLAHAEKNCRLDKFWSYRRKLLTKAAAFRYPSAPFIVELQDPFSGVLAHLPRLHFGQRGMIRGLVFLGDRLAARGADALALRMYGHAFEIAWRLATATGEEAAILDTLIGLASLQLTNGHLTEFWARRANAEKVAQVRRIDGRLDYAFCRLQTSLRDSRLDPLGHNDAAFALYLRAAGLAWWSALSGILLAVCSLGSAAGCLLLTRGAAVTATPSRLSGKALAALALVAVVVVAWIALAVPLDLESLDHLAAIAVWGYILAAAWAVAAGLLSARAACSAPPQRRWPPEWWWVVAGLAAAGAAFSAPLWADRPLSAAAATGYLGVLACIFAWCVLGVVGLLRRRTLADRARRRSTLKTFAVCSMFLAVVALVAALGAMGLTRHQQDRYSQALLSERKDEVRAALGADWPECLQPPPPALFSTEDTAPQ